LLVKRIQVAALLWLGKRLFSFVKTWAPQENQAPTVVHFAHSERDFNIAARQHIEELDIQCRKCNDTGGYYQEEPGAMGLGEVFVWCECPTGKMLESRSKE
jgi:hypothetical protein